FDDFFNKYFLAQFASNTPAIHDNLPRLRSKLKLYFNSGKWSPAHDHLNELVLKKMTDIVVGRGGQLDSTSKFNAMLALGELSEGSSGEGAKPKPWDKPFSILLGALKSAKTLDYVKMAALVGLERYAAAGAIPQSKIADVTKTMVELVKQQEPPSDRDLAAHNWMRRSAGQILASLGNPGPDNSVVSALTSVIIDPKTRPSVRCDMVQCLGQLRYPPGAKVDFQSLANSVGHETLEICKHELESAKAAHRAPSRRLLSFVLGSALLGLEGSDGKGGLLAAAAATPDNQKFIETLRGKVKTLSTSLEDSELPEGSPDFEVLKDLESALVPVPAAKAEKQAAVPAAAGPEAAAAHAAAGATKVGS
ncbi:MAG TPA: hypothetical protein VHV08_02850, partial [Pirellulales bacterium]|nr:hypothetical protein [Pirellulales bacterium]